MPGSVINSFRGFAELNNRGPSNAGNALYGRSSRSTKGKPQPQSEGEMLKHEKAKAETIGKMQQVVSGFIKSVDGAENKEAAYNMGRKVINSAYPGLIEQTYTEHAEGVAQGRVTQFKALEKAEMDFVREDLKKIGIPSEIFDSLPKEYQRELINGYSKVWVRFAAGDVEALREMKSARSKASTVAERLIQENEEAIRQMEKQQDGGNWFSRLFN